MKTLFIFEYDNLEGVAGILIVADDSLTKARTRAEEKAGYVTLKEVIQPHTIKENGIIFIDGDL